MQNLIDEHRETALDSPYSRDREAAIEELGTVFADADERSKRRIAETLREVACDSAHRQERDLARETLHDCFAEDPSTISSIVVETLSEVAESSKFSDERIAAIDALRDIYPDIEDPQQETVGHTLAEIAGNATNDRERQRARRRLSDVTRDNLGDGADSGAAGHQNESTTNGSDTRTVPSAVSYLGQSLADHLDAAAEDSAEACLQRTEEVAEFLEAYPVDDDGYHEVREDVENLRSALRVVSDDAELQADRIQRVQRVARRVERLYTRT